MQKSFIALSFLLLTGCASGAEEFKLSNGGTLFVERENVYCTRDPNNDGGEDPTYTYCRAAGVIEMPSGKKIDWSKPSEGCYTEPNGPVSKERSKNDLLCTVAARFKLQ